MNIAFEKYHGTGNDFILVDNRNGHFPKQQTVIANLCHRRYGIGADGLILIENHEGHDFEMVYYNADGNLGSMCGNGGRCAVIFAKKHKLFDQEANFLAYDGLHQAIITAENHVKLSMADVNNMQTDGNDYILDTGSPHLVRFIKDVVKLDVVKEGRRIRYSTTYREKGINVNFASLESGICTLRTYERGVEEETLSCGTGTVAVAIASSVHLNRNEGNQEYLLQAPGGTLKVYFNKKSANHYTAVYLEGPVEFVFCGDLAV